MIIELLLILLALFLFVYSTIKSPIQRLIFPYRQISSTVTPKRGGITFPSTKPPSSTVVSASELGKWQKSTKGTPITITSDSIPFLYMGCYTLTETILYYLEQTTLAKITFVMGYENALSTIDFLDNIDLAKVCVYTRDLSAKYFGIIVYYDYTPLFPSETSSIYRRFQVYFFDTIEPSWMTQSCTYSCIPDSSNYCGTTPSPAGVTVDDLLKQKRNVGFAVYKLVV